MLAISSSIQAMKKIIGAAFIIGRAVLFLPPLAITMLAYNTLYRHRRKAREIKLILWVLASAASFFYNCGLGNPGAMSAQWIEEEEALEG